MFPCERNYKADPWKNNLLTTVPVRTDCSGAASLDMDTSWENCSLRKPLGRCTTGEDWALYFCNRWRWPCATAALWHKVALFSAQPCGKEGDRGLSLRYRISCFWNEAPSNEAFSNTSWGRGGGSVPSNLVWPHLPLPFGFLSLTYTLIYLTLKLFRVRSPSNFRVFSLMYKHRCYTFQVSMRKNFEF